MSFGIELIPTQYFKPLEQSAFLSLKHTASLKGLFKGKSLEEWASECEQLREGLIHLGRHEVLMQLKTYPFALLPIELAQQTTGAGTAFLRWRRKDRSEMGVQLWDTLISSPCVSTGLIHDLLAIEMQRIVLNMQVSIVHNMMRQSLACAQKIEHAQQIHRQRF